VTPDRTHVEVRPGAYADSVTLLQVSKQVAAAPGVAAAQVAMATPLNLDLISGMGFEVPAATSNDLLVAVRLTEDGSLDAALSVVGAALAAATRSDGGGAEQLAPPRTTGSALTRSSARLALVSVPGPSAFVEAMDAVEAGCDVMIFSDNVPVEQEVALKDAAERAGVLVMGPDCGTAMVGGLGLGFANVVRPGPGRHRGRVGDRLPARHVAAGRRRGRRERGARRGRTGPVECGRCEINPAGPAVAGRRSRHGPHRRRVQAARSRRRRRA
jgi:FdrA protein